MISLSMDATPTRLTASSELMRWCPQFIRNVESLAVLRIEVQNAIAITLQTPRIRSGTKETRIADVVSSPLELYGLWTVIHSTPTRRVFPQVCADPRNRVEIAS